MAKVKLLNPETGNIGEVDADNVIEFVKAGAQPVEDMELFNPETGKTGMVKPEVAAQVLTEGALPVGSRAHQVATTGTLEALARGAGQGATFGFLDELQAGVRAPFSDRTYEQLRDEYRTADKLAQEAHPTAYTAAEIGGGLGTAFIPGLGATGALAKGGMTLGKELALGAKLGGLAGAGYSEQKDLTGIAKDVATGATMGGVAGGAGNVLGKAVSGVAKPVVGAVKEAFDPYAQTLLALGGKTKDFLDNRGVIERSIKKAREAGWFMPEPGSTLPPDQPALMARLSGEADKAADELVTKFSAAKGMNVSLDKVLSNEQLDTIQGLINRSEPGVAESVKNAANTVLDRIIDSNGDLGRLWEIKKDLGRYVADAWKQPLNRVADKDRLYTQLNQHIGQVLDAATENLGGPALKEINSRYGAATNLLEIVNKAQAQDSAASKLLGGFRFTTGLSGGLMGAMAGAVGGPVAGAVGAAAGTAATHAYKSTSGRLMRAQIGEMLHVGQQQQAAAMGAIPRTVQGIKQWIVGKEQMVDQFMPGLRPELERILAGPEGRAEVELRALMPAVQKFLAPSPFQSELNGKVSSPSDKIAITKDIRSGVTGAKTPSDIAIQLSKFNRDSKIPMDIFAGGEENYEDNLTSFANRLSSMGY